MPQLIVAGAAALASWGATALAVELGIAAAGSLLATAIGATAGFLVAAAGSMLLSAFSPKPRLPDYSQDRRQAVRSAIAPQAVAYGRTMVSGPVVYIGSSGPEQAVLHVVVALTGHQVEDIEEVWINEEQRVVLAAPGTGSSDPLDRANGAFGGTVRIHTYDGTQTTADPDLLSEKPDEWTSDKILTDCAYITLRIEYRREYLENFSSVSAVVKGKLVWDPRDDSTAWSANAALCILDYMLSDLGMNVDPAEDIDESYWIAAANICDEAVGLVSGGSVTEPRYELHGTFKLDQTSGDIMTDLLSACGGALTYVGGKYRLHVAAYEAPEITLTEADFAGDIKVIPTPPRRSVINEITGTYIDPARNWTAVSMPPVQVSDFVDEDGETISNAVEFPFVTSRTQAQRLARAALLRARKGLTIEVPVKMTAQAASVWTMIGVTVADLEWEDKAFRITGWSFDPVSAVITLQAREEYSTSYTWVYSDAGPDLSDFEPTVIRPSDIITPEDVAVTASTDLQPDGSTAPALVVTWTAQANPFVSSVEVQWQVDGDTDWSSIEVPAGSTRAVIAPVVSGVDYNVRVRAKSAFLVSAWSSEFTETGAPDTTAPGVPTSLAATAISTGISLTWTNPSDTDLVGIEVYENTTSSTTGRYFVGETQGTRFLRTGLGGSVTRYYWVRARDRSGNLSAFTSSVNATTLQVGFSDLEAWSTVGFKTTAANDTITVDNSALSTVGSLSIVVTDGGAVRIDFQADVTIATLPGDSGDGSTGGEGGVDGGADG